MPTYEYQCSACDAKMEFVESIKSHPRKICPICKRSKLIRLISKGTSVIFKGTGWTRSPEYNRKRRIDMEKEVSEKDCSGMTHS